MTYYPVRITEGNVYAGATAGQIVRVTEPIARCLCGNGVAVAVDETKQLLKPKRTRAKAGTKMIAEPRE